MARATRSTTSTQQTQQRQDQPRKRKRNSSQSEDNHITKHLRTDDTHQYSIDIHQGLQILAVLELEDTQGLLDRVFDSHSLRSLLSNPKPLSIVRDAIHNLLPISSLPRARLSAAAEQQLRFCNLALSLLDRISISPPLHIQSILPSEPLSLPPSSPTRKYALVQHLPAGDYWSSLDAAPPSQSNISLKDLPTGHAELVAILPSSSNADLDAPPTLAALSAKSLGHKKTMPPQRRITTGSFLDYGAYASFAPSFDHDCELVGRRQLGEVLYYQEQRKIDRAGARRETLEGRGSIKDVEDDVVITESSNQAADVDVDLNALLPPEEVDAIKAAMNSLELENSIQELLQRNRLALKRLEELQIRRLTEGSNSAEEGSEEWDTAQCIFESLTVLSSLRPRSSAPNIPSLVPPSPVLRKLHRTLALESSPGWHGTLPASRTTALRDDSTVKVKASAAGSTVPTTSVPVPITATPVTASQPPSAAPYPGYPYTYAPNSQQAQQGYRPPGAGTPYTPYKPSQAPAFFQGYVPPGTQQQQSYYNQQSFVGTSNQQPYGSGTTSQQPYTYQSWFTPSQYPSQTTSGRGTPQPAVATPTTYGTFFNAAINPVASNGTPPPGVRTPAVANTVASNKTTVQQPVASAAPWTATQAQAAAPTLPAHLRSATSSPAVGYFGGYQAQPPPATPAQ